MNVLDRLPGLRTRIEDHSVASVGDAFSNCDLPGMSDQVSQQVTASRAKLSQIRVVGARDYQHMDRRLRIYVAKRNCA